MPDRSVIVEHPAPEAAANIAAVSPALQLRQALGAFSTGVTVISTVTPAGDPIGLTVNSFNALSLDPPLVLWSLRSNSACAAAFVAAKQFTVNVLAEEQLGISRQFAQSAEDRFKDITWLPWRYDQSAAPLLKGCVALFECHTVSHQVAGDHLLFIGQVKEYRHHRERRPLIFHGGRYHLLGTAL